MRAIRLWFLRRKRRRAQAMREIQHLADFARAHGDHDLAEFILGRR